MKTILKNLSLMLALLISLCSCYETWVNPISDVQDAKVDERLIGTWGWGKRKHEKSTVEEYKFKPKEFADHSIIEQQEEDKAKIELFFIYEIDEHSMYVYTIMPDPMDPDSACVMGYSRMHVSELEGRTFLNWRTFDCSTKEFSRYGILEYEFNGENEVIFYLHKSSFVNQAIGSKRLSGEQGSFGNEVVTATSQEIREFIKNSPKEKLFERDNPLFILKRFERPKGTKKSICILF